MFRVISYRSKWYFGWPEGTRQPKRICSIVLWPKHQIYFFIVVVSIEGYIYIRNQANWTIFLKHKYLLLETAKRKLVPKRPPPLGPLKQTLSKIASFKMGYRQGTKILSYFFCVKILQKTQVNYRKYFLDTPKYSCFI